MKSLPISQDAQPDNISPEGAEVANTYLEQGCSIEKTSELLGIPGHKVNSIIASKPVKNYIIQVMTDVGMRSMDKITDSMQELIDKKLKEMDELEMTSSKDVADLLQMLHKMHTEKSKILLSKVPKDTINSSTNTNVAIFNADDNSQYARLMKAIIEG